MHNVLAIHNMIITSNIIMIMIMIVLIIIIIIGDRRKVEALEEREEALHAAHGAHRLEEVVLFHKA